jgi:hypothetical protein
MTTQMIIRGLRFILDTGVVFLLECLLLFAFVGIDSYYFDNKHLPKDLDKLEKPTFIGQFLLAVILVAIFVAVGFISLD